MKITKINSRHIPHELLATDTKPNPHRFKNVYKAACEWAAKHPNPLAPIPRTRKLMSLQ